MSPLVPTRAKEIYFALLPKIPDVGNQRILGKATTTVAMRKLEVHLRQNKRISERDSISNAGHSEKDPFTEIKSHELFPLSGTELTGGYKGFELSFMVEILCGILSGSNCRPNIPMWYPDSRNQKANLSDTFIAIDPTVFAQ
ncbi:uncharacterized oxidoreductase YjmC-like [Euwallacea fornicatus]|uniref:uncharacterized oxidoreductase YjmC-like n=1 Tax=Euwallacea fornicatus TaxID=995702 RepID=UPI0033902858